MKPERPMVAPSRRDIVRTTLPLAVVAGVSLGLTPAPNEWGLLAYPGLAFLLFAVAPPGYLPSVRNGFIAGFVFSFLVNAVALYWMVGLLETFAGFPTVAAIPTAGLLFAAQALPMAAACAFAAALSQRRFPVWAVLPPLLTLFSDLAPTLFPWRLMHSQTGFPVWLQLADIGGQPLLDLCLTYAAMGLGQALVHRDRRAAVIGAVALTLPLVYGAYRIEEVRAERLAAPTVRIGVVQPNVSIQEKNNRDSAPARLASLQELTRDLESSGADLVVWPETAYPYLLPRSWTRDSPGRWAILNRGAKGPLLVGTVTRNPDAGRYNSVVAVNPDGTFSATADKVELLAFGEYVPLWDYLIPIQEYFPRGMIPGDAPKVIEIAGARVGVLNCYEDVLAEYAILVGRNDPDVLVNVTNDAWFGHTTEPFGHEAQSRLRSIETRRDLVRAVNTGVSSHTAATGESLLQTPTFVRDAFIAEVHVLSEVTPWVRFGNWPRAVLYGALLGLALAAQRRDLWARPP